MNHTQIVLFLAFVGFGCLVQPTFARPVRSDSITVNTQGRRTGENAVPVDQILAVLRGVEAAFSDTDLRGYLSFFHSSYLIMAPEGVIAPASENEALALLRPQIENLRARGYARSELNRVTVKLLSASTALAAVEWIRRKANKEELERLGATYAFFKGENGWKIVMVTVHSPATLLELK